MNTNDDYQPVTTFSEVYGTVPRALLSLFKARNVSSADYDLILIRHGWQWNSPEVNFADVFDYVEARTVKGQFRDDYYA